MLGPLRPDSRLFDFSLLGTVSRIAWPIPLAAELRDLGHRRLGVAHKCPGNCRGMRLPGPPNNQLILLASCCANVELVL